MNLSLSWNGVPPQIVGALDEKAQRVALDYADADKHEVRHGLDYRDTDALAAFGDRVTRIVQGFADWGAGLLSQRLHFFAKSVARGGTNYSADMALHSDDAQAFCRMRSEARLALRFLAVSGTPADFIDLTDRPDMYGILEKNRSYKHYYERTLFDFAEAADRLVKPQAWDIVMFDAATPHLPHGVAEDQRRILMHGWIDMQLPADWQRRLAAGDAPKLG